jgi:hypothetical protein
MPLSRREMNKGTRKSEDKVRRIIQLHMRRGKMMAKREREE